MGATNDDLATEPLRAEDLTPVNIAWREHLASRNEGLVPSAYRDAFAGSYFAAGFAAGVDHAEAAMTELQDQLAAETERANTAEEQAGYSERRAHDSWIDSQRAMKRAEESRHVAEDAERRARMAKLPRVY